MTRFFLSDLTHLHLKTDGCARSSTQREEASEESRPRRVRHTVGLQWDRLLQKRVSLDAHGPPNQRLPLAQAHTPFVVLLPSTRISFFWARRRRKTAQRTSTYKGIQSRCPHASFLPGARNGRIATGGCDRIRGEPIAGYHRDPFLRPLTWAGLCEKAGLRRERRGTNCPREKASAERLYASLSFRV